MPSPSAPSNTSSVARFTSRGVPRTAISSGLTLPIRHIRLDAGGDSADGREETLRVHAHPNHHDDEREDGRPFAGSEIPDMRSHLGTGLAIKHALVHPEHVAGGEDHAEGGPHG